MDDEAARKDVLKTARSLISKDGSNFTVAALCKKSGLSRTKLRRLFPTKVALLSALDEQIIAETLAKLNETKAMPETGEWVERRFRVLERAIALLETRVDSVSAEHARLSSAQAEAEMQEPALLQAPEPPPLAVTELEAVETAEVPEPQIHDTAPESYAAPELPPLLEEPVSIARPMAPNVMREILENARALANSAAEIEVRHQKSELTNTKLVMIGAAAIVIVGLIIGVVSLGSAARATQSPMASSKISATAPGFTIINATGAAILDQMTPEIRAKASRAEKGDSTAQAELALAYLRGDGVPSDPVAAVGWAGLAAAKGQPQGQFILGTLYNSGINRDPRMGFRWMAAAALNGNVKAMHNVAVAFVSGTGIEKDPIEAANWFNKAASLGYRDSAFDLAVLYERGEGVAQSTQRALYWYDSAASAGDREAAQRASLLRFGVAEVAGNPDADQANAISRLQ